MSNSVRLTKSGVGAGAGAGVGLSGGEGGLTVLANADELRSNRVQLTRKINETFIFDYFLPYLMRSLLSPNSYEKKAP